MATTYYWTFGDGETSTEENPSHTYINYGKYTVILTVTIDGTQYSKTRTYYIYIIPETENNPFKTTVCFCLWATPNTIDFSDEITSDLAKKYGSLYEWSDIDLESLFGDESENDNE